MSYVKVSQLTKSFGDVTVFQDINFEIEKGEFITLLGPSGCGKSTLLRCLAGLNQVDDGELWVDGEDITDISPQQREIGMVFQSYALFPNMTVEDNVAFGLKMKGISKSEARSEAKKMIDLVELDGKEKFYPSELSGGQRQRVALARALVVKPRILLLDEPLSALDAKIRKSLRQQILNIQRELNLTTVFVTHDTKPANEFVASFMGHYNLIEAETANQWFNLASQEKVAIRPESIYIREAGRKYGEHISAPMPATVLSHQLLGNVIRYNLKVEENELTVDLLNRSSERLMAKGSSLELMFNLNEIQPVRA